MSLTVRIIIGNLFSIFLTIAVMIKFNTINGWLELLIGTTLMIVSSLVIGMICKHSFKPLGQIVEIMEKAASGDLTARADVSGGGDFTRIAVAFNSMMSDMNGAMRSFFSVADTVRGSVAHVCSTIDSVAEAAEDVALQAATIATASEEMAATSCDIAQNCLAASDSAKVAADKTHDGSNLVHSSARMMEDIARRVNSSAHSVEGLGQRSDQIGEIVSTIQDIADQTNLLALNAAIEAARAGEQGRGFAVVADEVRSLAKRTTKATKEIAAMISSIQRETLSAVESMSEGVEKVRLGTLETTSSGEALNDILTRIKVVTDQINQIAVASEEQTATTREITNNIHAIAEIVKCNASSSRTTKNASELLAGQVDELHKLVGKFRLTEALELDSSFATGIERFDSAHKVLFRMVNELHDAMQEKRSHEAIGAILSGLADYTVNHFAEEERSFAQTGFSDEQSHRQLHRQLVDQVTGLIGRFNAGEVLLTQEVINFLQDWLTNHIKGVDKKYGPHLIKNGFR
ncbi:MAG TPA: bacteriohemerythrin [Desulfuromonadales bacterium]|nr:bacteriohemerythrin [Desulfuromonadales bacterium]